MNKRTFAALVIVGQLVAVRLAAAAIDSVQAPIIVADGTQPNVLVSTSINKRWQMNERLQDGGLPAGRFLDKAAFVSAFVVPQLVNDGQRHPIERLAG
jgi:hypothetical protein